MNISAKTKICMVIGDPIDHSLSPQIHNIGYQSLGIKNKFVYVACRVEAKNLANFIKGVRAMGIHGISCTAPHKKEIIKFLDEIDETAQKINAVNTIVNKNGKLKGYNTDWLGAVISIEKITSLKGKKIALIGAGGVARAIAYGITKKGASLMIFNQSVKNANVLTKEFGGKCFSLDKLNKIKDANIIINATSVGMYPKKNESIVPKKLISSKHIVFDVVYRPYETKLLREAKEQGAQVIYGAEMFLQQGIAQFEIYTKHNAPKEKMRSILLKNLKI